MMRFTLKGAEKIKKDGSCKIETQSVPSITSGLTNIRHGFTAKFCCNFKRYHYLYYDYVEDLNHLLLTGKF